MTIRGILGTQATCNALRSRINAALGLPRCELLAGNLKLDGVSIASNDPRLISRHQCSRADTPHAACPFATRSDNDPIELLTTWCYPVTESNATVMATLTAPERALIVAVLDSDIKPRP